MGQLHVLLTDLDEVSKCLLAGRTGEAAVHSMHPYVVLEQLQSFKGFRAQETRVGPVFRVHQQMVLQGRVTHEGLAADVAGKGVGVPAVDPQVLVQLFFVPEGLSAVGAFKRTKTFPYEKVLQCCILQRTKEEGEIIAGNPNSVH